MNKIKAYVKRTIVWRVFIYAAAFTSSFKG
jgi:hypothetical protein